MSPSSSADPLPDKSRNAPKPPAPAPLIVTAWFGSKTPPAICNEAPLSTVTAEPPAPTAAAFRMRSAPASITVPPVNVSSPLSANTPAPTLTSSPGFTPSAITPAYVVTGAVAADREYVVIENDLAGAPSEPIAFEAFTWSTPLAPSSLRRPRRMHRESSVPERRSRCSWRLCRDRRRHSKYDRGPAVDRHAAGIGGDESSHSTISPPPANVSV